MGRGQRRFRFRAPNGRLDPSPERGRVGKLFLFFIRKRQCRGAWERGRRGESGSAAAGGSGNADKAAPGRYSDGSGSTVVGDVGDAGPAGASGDGSGSDGSTIVQDSGATAEPAAEQAGTTVAGGDLDTTGEDRETDGAGGRDPGEESRA